MAERRDDAPDKAREEFFSEASELVDGFGRHLLALEESVENGHGPDPETLNDIFRGVHTLKGLSGLFGAATLSGLSHELENLLDDLRLGRIPLSTAVLDLLFDAVELYGRILSALKGEEAEPREEVLTLLASLAAVSNERSGNVAFIAEYELDPETLGVLTEYEEHRLRSNLQAGLALYRLKAKFPLATTRRRASLPRSESASTTALRSEMFSFSFSATKRASTYSVRPTSRGESMTASRRTRQSSSPSASTNIFASMVPPRSRTRRRLSSASSGQEAAASAFASSVIGGDLRRFARAWAAAVGYPGDGRPGGKRPRRRAP